MSLYQFAKYLSGSYLFISTSTGPMHLAGAVDIKTISFFGNTKFASYKRWATISNKENQNNFIVPLNYNKQTYLKIEKKLKELVDE